MVSDKIEIKNLLGLHLRPAGILCNEAMRYSSSIQMKKDNKTVNAKSVLGVLGACVKAGEQVEFLCEGEDEAEALAAMLAIVASSFGE